MTEKFAIIGMGQFGAAIARRLSAKGAEVIAIDADEEKIENIKDDVTYAVSLDATDKKALESQNLVAMDAVVVSIGANFQDLLLCCFQLQEIGVKRIIGRAQGRTQRKILEKMGITEILSPELEVANNMAENLMNPGLLMVIKLPDDYEIVEVKVPASIQNRTLGSLGLREKYRLNLVTLIKTEKGEQHILGVPGPETELLPEDLIVIFGKTKDINRFLEINT
jgi:trk system potassium uptake protein TrkA